MLLQRLIRQVDAQLLKVVLLEVLEPKDVQDANGTQARALVAWVLGLCV
jgi:hypothetical protein